MMSGVSEPNIPLDKPLSKTDPSQQHPQRWRTKTFLIVFAAIVAAIWGSVWWFSLLSSEEELYLGRWVAIESEKRNVPKEETLSTLIRELEFKPDHEVRLRLWTKDNIRLAFPKGALFPIRITGPAIDSGELSVVTAPHPATLPEALVSVPPGAEIIGRWSITYGQIDIVWDSNESITEFIRRKAHPITGGLLIIPSSRKAKGLLTRNWDDKITIQWVKESSKITGYVPPPQVWSRQQEKH